MKLWDILKTVGGGIISTMVPGGPAILGVVNALLPEDSKLPAGATGHDVSAAISSLPESDRAAIMDREFDVQIESIRQSHDTVRAMLASDAVNPQSTRPRIALGAFHILSFVQIVTISIWAYGVFTKDAAIVKTTMDGWPFVLALVGPSVTLLLAYFGVIKQENKNKLDASNGVSNPGGLAGIIGSLFKGK